MVSWGFFSSCVLEGRWRRAVVTSWTRRSSFLFNSSMERGKPPSSSSSDSSRLSDPGNAKVIEWEDFEQELARLWSLSSALEEAKQQKESLKQKLDSLIKVYFWPRRFFSLIWNLWLSSVLSSAWEFWQLAFFMCCVNWGFFLEHWVLGMGSI